MVYTVTFNPALDYVVRVEDFQPGETNRTTSDEVQFGGKGINVSTVLRNLGVDNVALGFLAGFTGKGLEQGLREMGINTDFIWLERGLTRINVKIKAGQETEINGQGPDISPAALEQLFAHFTAAGGSGHPHSGGRNPVPAVRGAALQSLPHQAQRPGAGGDFWADLGHRRGD